MHQLLFSPLARKVKKAVNLFHSNIESYLHLELFLFCWIVALATDEIVFVGLLVFIFQQHSLFFFFFLAPTSH